MTVTWELVDVGEFVLRIASVYNLPAPVVLALSPFSTGLVTVGTSFGHVDTHAGFGSG